MCGLSSDHDHYPYMYLVSVLFTSSCIYSLTLHPIHFFKCFFYLLYMFYTDMTPSQNGHQICRPPIRPREKTAEAREEHQIEKGDEELPPQLRHVVSG